MSKQAHDIGHQKRKKNALALLEQRRTAGHPARRREQ
jgi:hypothetical protein